MVFALSGAHEVGLAVAGAIFVSFSLLSAFVFPRFNPDFPGGGGLRWYIPLCVLIFVGMISSVLVFGRDEKKAAAATTTTTSAYANGSLTVGKTVFSASCATCHTLTAAAATGTIGPNLDDVASYAAKAKQPLDQFLVAAITKPPAAYVPPGFPTTTMPTNFGSSLTAPQIAGLVAFIAHAATG